MFGGHTAPNQNVTFFSLSLSLSFRRFFLTYLNLTRSISALFQLYLSDDTRHSTLDTLAACHRSSRLLELDSRVPPPVHTPAAALSSQRGLIFFFYSFIWSDRLSWSDKTTSDYREANEKRPYSHHTHTYTRAHYANMNKTDTHKHTRVFPAASSCLFSQWRLHYHRIRNDKYQRVCVKHWPRTLQRILYMYYRGHYSINSIKLVLFFEFSKQSRKLSIYDFAWGWKLSRGKKMLLGGSSSWRSMR